MRFTICDMRYAICDVTLRFYERFYERLLICDSACMRLTYKIDSNLFTRWVSEPSDIERQPRKHLGSSA